MAPNAADRIIKHLLDNALKYTEKKGTVSVSLKRIPHPDLIISDIMMDRMDGYRFYEALKEEASSDAKLKILYSKF